MAHNVNNVKGQHSSELLEWVDAHPRLGWYVSIWAILVTLNLLFDLVEWVL